jgi:hypothetical protein
MRTHKHWLPANLMQDGSLPLTHHNTTSIQSANASQASADSLLGANRASTQNSSSNANGSTPVGSASVAIIDRGHSGSGISASTIKAIVGAGVAGALLGFAIALVKAVKRKRAEQNEFGGWRSDSGSSSCGASRQGSASCKGRKGKKGAFHVSCVRASRVACTACTARA